MFGLSVLTHGEDDGLLMAFDGPMHVADLVDPIKTNLTLLGKPKVSFCEIFVKIICNFFSYFLFKHVEDRPTWTDGK